MACLTTKLSLMTQAQWRAGKGEKQADGMMQSQKLDSFGKRGWPHDLGFRFCYTMNFVTFGKLLTFLEQFPPPEEEGSSPDNPCSSDTLQLRIKRHQIYMGNEKGKNRSGTGGRGAGM